MARFAGSIRDSCMLIWPFACVLVCFAYFSIASPTHGRRLICWQAILNCHSEPECHYAYGQYLHACDPILNGQKKKCPSHCISSLVQLNLTKNGPALEDCSCASDNFCRDTKRAIEPCLPKTSSMGCTEARRQCERDYQCRTAMGDYLLHCGKLFSGATCTNACRNVIANMRKLPKAQLLDTCICDGTERTICEFVKISMKNLCFDSPPVDEEGSSGSDYDDEDDEDDTPERTSVGSTGLRAGAWGALTGTASILVLLRFFGILS
ncbi:growth arrest-specific protein 1a [Electrophorus electricus]|uniref:GDNF/GAS1 domain-containing protein n=1 Tax=Electrophorus electricus TaxID=8005 RepID=A0A4W4E5W7_ELEEL|nr:growth arrest-specific protein 1a [Electrophorus electricus]